MVTAAVCVDGVFDDESQSLEKSEKAEHIVKAMLYKRESEDLQIVLKDIYVLTYMLYLLTEIRL